ncbi:MAG: c-type cytochrome [Planctomycetes bacterium]|nr:c-type cytochrome [Planctomycetota bacterium]
MNTLLLLAATTDAASLPSASTFAPAVDQTFLLAAWFAVFLVVLATGAMLLVLAGGRSSAPAGTGVLGSGARRVVQSGVLVSVLLVAGFLVHGAFVWADLQVVPRGALPVQVALGDKGWSFTYPNGYVATELHLPIDRPVKLRFQAAREPYTFSVPAFRLQVPVAQGEKRDAWVQATLAGEYELFSTLRPASPFALATAQTVVHAEGGYDKWYQDISGPPLDLPPVELGQRSYQMRGCTQCHTVDGTKLVGPSFKGFLAREHKLTDGQVVEPNDAYIQESIEDPTAKVLAGFEPVMPSFKGRLPEPEIKGLIAYIKSLQ